MNIVACVKRVPSTEAQAKIAGDAKSLETGDFQYMISFYDEIALEEAVKTKETLGAGDVTVLSIGPSESSKELRECLAKGGDKAVLMTDPNWLTRDARATAKALANKLEAMGAEIAFMGRVATDRDNAAVGPMTATYLGWACVTEVIEFNVADGKGTAKCETENGVETVEFKLPAVVCCNKGLNEPRYAGLKGIMAAKKKPLEEEACEEIANHAQVTLLELPAERGEGRIVGEGVEAIPALIDALRNEAQVL